MDSFLVICLLALMCSLVFLVKCLVGVVECIFNIQQSKNMFHIFAGMDFMSCEKFVIKLIKTFYKNPAKRRYVPSVPYLYKSCGWGGGCHILL